MPIFENRYVETEDKILQGFILLAMSFLKVNPQMKELLSGINFKNQEKHILTEFYNSVFFFDNHISDESILNLPKCKKKKTRNMMFSLLLRLVENSEENFKILLPLLSKNHH